MNRLATLIVALVAALTLTAAPAMGEPTEPQPAPVSYTDEHCQGDARISRTFRSTWPTFETNEKGYEEWQISTTLTTRQADYGRQCLGNRVERTVKCKDGKRVKVSKRFTYTRVEDSVTALVTWDESIKVTSKRAGHCGPNARAAVNR